MRRSDSPWDYELLDYSPSLVEHVITEHRAQGREFVAATKRYLETPNEFVIVTFRRPKKRD